MSVSLFQIKLPPRERVVRAKIKLLKEKPFFGYPLMHIQIAAEGEPKLKRVRIVYNPEYIQTLSDEQLMGVLSHELLHYLCGHVRRQKELKKKEGNVDPRKANLAMDTVVNAILYGNGITLPDDAILPGEDPTGRLYVILTDARGEQFVITDPDKKTWEEVYWELDDFDATNYSSGNGGTMWIEEDGEDDNDESEGNAESEGTMGLEDVKPPEELLSEAYTYAKMHGKEPAGITRHYNEATKPRVDFRRVMQNFVRSRIPHDFTYQKPDKNSTDSLILPGVSTLPVIDGVVATDTSGSISDRHLGMFVKILEMLVRNYRILRLTVLCADAEVQGQWNVRTLKDLKNIVFRGGGGTDFRPVFEFATEKRAKFLIFLTDGDGIFPEKKPKFPVLWVVTPDGVPESSFPFGKVVRIEQ